MVRRLTVLTASLLFLGTYLAQAAPIPTLKSWYAMLESGNVPRVAALLTDDAVIVLNDLGVEQSKTEFIDSLDGWNEAFDGGSLDWRIEDESGSEASILVCYRFPGNMMLVREVFTFSDHQIQRSVQTQIADNCDAY